MALKDVFKVNEYKQEITDLRQQVETKEVEMAETREEISKINATVEQVSKEFQEFREEQTMNFYGADITVDGGINNVPNGSREENVLRIPTASACLDKITKSIAQMPIYLYREIENADGTTEIDKVNGDYRVKLLNEESELDMSAVDFKKAMIKDLVLHGQAFAYLRKKSDPIDIGGTVEMVDGDIQELNYLPAKYMVTQLLENDGIKYINAKYTFTNIWGINMNQKKTSTILQPNQLLRVLNNPINAFEGEGLLFRGKNLFEQALSEIEYTKGIYNNSATPRGILKLAGRLSQGAIDKLKQSWQNLYAGPKKSGSTVILEDGMDFQPIQLNPNDMQMAETTKATSSKICELFGVPESMISTAQNKYNSIEQNELNFLKHTLAPIIKSFESACDRQLLTEQEKADGYFFQFDTAELLRTTEGERTATLVAQVNAGLITENEARIVLNRPPVEDGDVIRLSLGNVLKNIKTGEIKVPNMDGGTANQEQQNKGEVANGQPTN